MTNLYNEKMFTHTTKSGTEYTFWCYYQSTQTGFRHLCYDYPLPMARREGFIYQKDWKAKQCWCNRTWEEFTYKTVLEKAIETVAKSKEEYQELIDVLINHKIETDKQECEKFLKDFENTYKQLPQGCKDTLAKSNIILETEEQAKDLLGTMKLINAITTVTGGIN